MTQAEAIQALEREYARQRAENEDARAERLSEARRLSPAIAHLQGEIASALSEGARSMLLPGDARAAADALKARVGALSAEIHARLREVGLPPDYLDMRYRCRDCHDTGYVGDALQTRCACFERQLLAMQFERAQGNPTHCFERFDPAIFPSDAQRAQAEGARAMCEDYARRSADGLPNLVLMGASGLGKTFLLDSIAQRLTERGQPALTVTGFRMFEAMRAYHLSDDGGTFERMLECPCLLIDDLGTEPMFKNITVEYLFTLLNERVAARRRTVIATNLMPVQLIERYGERVVSRLLDRQAAEVVRLIGEDLRLRKS